ncbi:hypothetical protein [Reyranella sp.]|uniref:hypothetical protein n=1 Tax=Reyranella sp. TaxID=1929291 RepID=UPI00120C19AF|nr:hypothetical protein [Reyranella sp.]TAJ82529.1 MAG: hypothetical protein EPO50_27350 [Reyranella sp.]
MRLIHRIVATLSAAIALPAVVFAASIGGNYYAPQYDYRDFFAATDGKNFPVILAGDAFPGVNPAVVAKDLLPAMQAAKPRPALTFTYDRPLPPPSPDYRLVLIFDPANDLNADPVCAGTPPRFRQGRPGLFYVYAIYCRNAQAMSFTTAWTPATGPTDPRIEQLFRELFMVIFSDQQRRFAELNSAFR